MNPDKFKQATLKLVKFLIKDSETIKKLSKDEIKKYNTQKGTEVEAYDIDGVVANPNQGTGAAFTIVLIKQAGKKEVKDVKIDFKDKNANSIQLTLPKEVSEIVKLVRNRLKQEEQKEDGKQKEFLKWLEGYTYQMVK